MEYTFSTRTKNGSICLILAYKIGKKWRQKTKQGFKTMREARKAQDELLALAKKEVGFTAPADLKDLTLRQFWPMYKRDKTGSLAVATLWSYEVGLKHFAPILDIPLRNLSTAAIVNAFQQIPNSWRSKNINLAALRTVLEHAKKVYKLIPTNPAAAVQRLKSRKKEPIRAMTRDDLSVLLDTLKAGNRPALYLLVLIAASTGMRCGEILGLTWDSIDWTNRTIKVGKQWTKQTHHSYGFAPCKTKNSYRTVHASSAVLSALRKWHDSRPLSFDNRVFGGISTSYLCAAASKAIKQVVPGMTLHSLRHTFATLLLQRTGDVNLVAGVLGDTVVTVSNTYLDYTQDLRDRAAAEMETLL